MSDELGRLRNMPPPPPRLAAKKRALAAGVAAFQAAQGQARTITPGAQGKSAKPRLTLATQQSARSKFMVTRTYYALAASVAVVALGAPMAYELWQQRQLGMFSKVSGQLDGPPAERRTRLAEQDKPAAPPRPEPQLKAEIAPSPTVAAVPAPSPAPSPPLAVAVSAPRPEAATAPAKAKAAAPVLAQSRVDETRGRAGGAASDTPQQVPVVGGLAAADSLGADYAPQQVEENRDKHSLAAPSPVLHVVDAPVSTFSIDVDTASYAFARRALNAGQLPQRASVRVEEMINYFPYDYPRPESAAAPFRPTVTVAPSPWAPGNKLIHIAIKGYDIERSERPRANIVLLVDVSGSMAPADRLPLLKNAYRLLLDELQPQDSVAIVTYANGVATALPPTRAAHKQRILAAIERLGAGGGTAGADGLQRAYQLAQENFDPSGVNRIILGTDGDFNLGISDTGQLKSFIEQKRASGIFLSVLGVGHGNYNDDLMQALAQNGNGAAAYIDTLSEARKVLAQEVSSTLFPIARDVKIQIEFNPAAVSDYRLIGYETRALKREDFNNDKVDAGDIGSGHTVTAIYEITPRGAPGPVDDLRYGADKARTSEAPRVAPNVAPGADDSEYGFLKLRYKLPSEDTSRLISVPVTRALEVARIEDAPREMRFSLAVAAFGQLLQGAQYLKDFGYDQVLALAGGARGEDAFGYRAEFMNLARLAKSARQ